MTVLSEYIYPAFRRIGVKTADLTATQLSNSLIALNNMLASWGADFRTISVVTEDFTMTAGTESYTVGSGGDFDTTRPMKLHRCFLRDSNGIDIEIKVMGSRDYGRIQDKDASGRPRGVYFMPGVSTATVTFDCAPSEAYGVHFEFWKNFTAFGTVSSATTYPGEYNQAIVLNLAINLDELWDRKTPPNTLFAQAQESKAILDRLNSTTRRVNRTIFDFPGRGRYNINTDGS